MSTALWAAFGGFVLGSVQSLMLEWVRERERHRRQLRMWRNELRRLRSFDAHFAWNVDALPTKDALPNPPRTTPSYRRLLDETDFWVTDQHSDDNTGHALINIADGVDVLAHYHAEALKIYENIKTVRDDEQVEQWTRVVRTTHAYDLESTRWIQIVESAQDDIDRRLELAGAWSQLVRLFRPMPIGENPPPLPPIDPP
ncbi:MAG TPA: hypothetical protein VGE27_03125 [Gemmatimonas sp.]|uniref:hypothetical protein n=1 Tax=Gemmatimonas sp. TaxID=1962908 RepID=UPI002ED9B4FE